MANHAQSAQQDDGKFGTVGGVFTPCVLTILGVIMFLRFGEVVGQAGILSAVLIVLGAKFITTLTAFSLSAVATNTRVRGGGAYFVISRSLGVEFGAVIGIVFYLAQAVSVSMYVIGFTEAFLDTFPNLGVSFLKVATVVNAVTFICVYIGAGWTIRVQYVILAVLALAIASFAIGALGDVSLATLSANRAPAYREGDSFFTMFALFFPAVTGIMAGANMSGDLRDASRSIPRGTLSAIAVTALVYLAMAVLLAASRPHTELLGSSMVVKDIAWLPALVVAGVFAATLSSALGSMMGAPRILQAFARDDIIREIRYFAAGSGRAGEPRRATVLTFAIAQTGVMIGDLNAIAPIITMFFMITYGTLNLACFYESITRNPSYRPKFRYSHWSLALIGTVGCGGVALLINPLWALIAIAIMGALYWWISRIEIISRWGDVKSGAAFERARKALLKLEESQYHPKNWRPSILALSGGAWSRYHLAEYAYWLAAGHGIVTLAQIISEKVTNNLERRSQAEKRLRKFIQDEGLMAFPAVVIEKNLSGGLRSFLQTHGLGGFRPNTVLMGVTREQERWPDFCQALRITAAMGRNLLLVDCVEDTERWLPPEGSIDVLWRGERHGALMVMMAHMLKANAIWRQRRLRILAVVPPQGDTDGYRTTLERLLATARIDGSVHVFGSEDLYLTLAKRTGNTAVLFVPFEPPAAGAQADAEFLEWISKITRLTPDIVMVYNAGGVSLEA
ncbi:MAG: amino acid permease [Gammaproteobacteria bacterium]|nr:amino acid permease [Gammaproteobacteria bacterium]